MKSTNKLVLFNQATNYLTIGLANAFNKRFGQVSLIAGSVHVQGEELDADIFVDEINRWHERPAWRKAISYVLALVRTWSLLLTRYRHYDVLFVSVPPMGYLLNLVVPNRFSMVIWDVYPDVLKVTGMRESSVVYRAWAALNRRSFAKAWRIYTISDSLADSLAKYVDRQRVVVHPIWSIFQENSRSAVADNPFVKKYGLEQKFVVQYSGNIGVTHNVESLVEVAENLKDEVSILFQIIGRGPRAPAIQRLVQERNLHNVQLLPFQSDAAFPYSLAAANLGVVVLNDAVSQGSIPSKTYNLMSFGIPALYIAGKDSELARYASTYRNARCFQAAEVGAISTFIRDLALDNELYRSMQSNAERAALDFRRSNADRFVDSYFRT